MRISKPVIGIAVGSISYIGRTLYEKFISTAEEPAIGAPIYCDLAPGMEHSGIYVGNGEVVALRGSGYIEKVSLKTFTHGYLPNHYIHYPKESQCDMRLGSRRAAQRAMAKVGSRRHYNLIGDNCHQFTAGCLTGDFENDDNFLYRLKDIAKRTLNGGDDIEWAVWDW